MARANGRKATLTHTESVPTPQNGSKAVLGASCASLTPLIGKVVRVYLRNKRSLSDGWHCGKLLSVAKGKAVIELRHNTTVLAGDVEEL